MITNYSPSKSAALDNQFHIVCPIFDAETPIAACLALRELVWAAKNPPQRKGCQLCMKANKCPVNSIAWDMMRTGTDPYHSTTKKVGKISDRHMAYIERTVVNDKEIERWYEAGNLSDAEAAKIRAANLAVRELVNAVKTRRDPNGIALEDVPVTVAPRKRGAATEPANDLTEDATIKAAMTGDLSSAINAATAKAA